jgi:hypothetical protein
MAMTTGGLSALLAPDLRQVYVITGKEWPLEHPIVVNTPEMEYNPVTDRYVSGLGSLPTKGEGQQFQRDEILIGATKTYTAVAYGMALEVTYEGWRDELYGVIEEAVRGLARASRHRMEYDAFAPFNNAFSTSHTGFYPPGGTPESLCSTDHIGLDGKSRANRPNPDASFGVTALQDAIIRFETMTNERGLPMLMAPVLVMGSPSNKWAFREILGSVGKPYETSNEINALIAEDLAWMICHYLTTTSAWFLLAAKGVHDINFFVRDEPIFDMFDDPWTKNGVCTVYQRHVSGFGSWRGVDGSYTS